MDWKFSYGENCKDNTLILNVITLEDLYTKITQADTALIELTTTLRSVLRYSKDRYRALKTTLPFFSCSVFEPAYRGVQNFKEAGGLVIDIDAGSALDPALLKKLKSDPRIALGYVSPSNLGVKLFIPFDEPVVDAAQYTRIYKAFAYQFSNQYHLADKLDMRNSDVSRISFICYDPSAWMLADGVPLIWRDIENTSMIVVQEDRKEAGEIPQDVYRQILNKLDTRPKIVKSGMPIAETLQQVQSPIAEALGLYGIEILDMEGIPYGMKLKIQKGKDFGELNVYTGKSGFRVVSTPRRGTHPELNEVSKRIVESVLFAY